MDLHTLKIFETVERLGSISLASRELQFAQSNITMKIQQLESDLQTTFIHI
ncbi:LysR family transcriptional regulator [Ornithinibacillus sp. BX22]|uniref:LysR family transcriptional regulator n=1 Tax=Ornithinibacillus hominis TaxID=2763055 RepID=A0A923RKA6_9BACI|nr:LysR family transcriptional regulator [Ornithinibacillus hominis]